MAKVAQAEGVLVDLLDPGLQDLDPAEAARTAAALRRLGPEAKVTVTVTGGARVLLPRALAPVIASILQEASEGNTVAVLSTAQEVSTGTAARLLGVSRPHVAKLIDARILPGRKVRSHRRVRLSDLLAYKRRIEHRQALLDRLIEETEAMGLYAPRPGSKGGSAG